MNSLSGEIKRIVRQKIWQFKESKAAMAKLRRGAGKELGEITELLSLVLPEKEICSYQSDELRIERALHVSITLYAVHQQGTDTCMSSGLEEAEGTVSRKNTFGHMVKKLVQKRPENEAGILRRFNQVLAARDLRELSVHARGLIKLCKAEKITLDYPAFTVDLYKLQQDELRKNVLLAWGRDYYMENRKED